MEYEGISKQMKDKGWISPALYRSGGVSIDLYYLWINGIDICLDDPYYILSGYFDKITIESQIESFIFLIKKYNKQDRENNADEIKYLKSQLLMLKAIKTIKIEQSN